MPERPSGWADGRWNVGAVHRPSNRLAQVGRSDLQRLAVLGHRTAQGTFELKYFFGSSLNTETGGNASSTAVRALIRQMVAAEDPKKPLSDSTLSEMLEEQGIQVARRTVAKYREALKIAPANLRKAI